MFHQNKRKKRRKPEVSLGRKRGEERDERLVSRTFRIETFRTWSETCF